MAAVDEKFFLRLSQNSDYYEHSAFLLVKMSHMIKPQSSIGCI